VSSREQQKRFLQISGDVWEMAQQKIQLEKAAIKDALPL